MPVLRMAHVAPSQCRRNRSHGVRMSLSKCVRELRKVCNYAYSRGDKYTSTVQMTVIRPIP